MQVVPFNNLQDNIVYHANIFNYDKKFLTTLLNIGIKLDFTDYSQEKNVKSEDIESVIEFLKSKSKNQVSLMTLAVDHEYRRIQDDDPELVENKQQLKSVTKTLRHLFKLFQFSYDKAMEKVKQAMEGEGKIEPGDINANNMITCLLYFDGISMVNIDIIKLIENNASYTSKTLVELVFMLLNNNYLDFHIKEIASHILSIDLMQNDGSNEEQNENFSENCINLMKWIYELSIQQNRHSCLTSNLSLLLTIDENLEYFLGDEFNKEYNHLRKIFDLMTDADININIIYESLLCLWSISSNKKYFYIFENKNNKYIEKIVQVIRTNKIDKVARIGLMTLQNLLDSQTCVEILFDIKFMQTVSILLTNKWNDPVIKEMLHFCLDFLEKNYKSMNSFEKFMKELDNGILKKGSLHTREFWEENYKEFEFSNFEYIRRLVKFVSKDADGEDQIEQQCIACFDLGEFARLYPGGASVLEYFGAKEHLLKLIQHKNMELKNRALVCLQKIMMKSLKK